MKRGTKKGWIRRYFAMLLAVILCTGCLGNPVMAAGSDSGAAGADTVRILFIGNSLTEYNDVPNKVKQIFAKAGKSVETEKLINLGQPLTLHKDNEETKEKILNGNFDYVVLQDKASGFKQSVLEEGAAAIAPWIEEAGAQLVLYMPWANESVFAEGQETFTNAYVSVGKEWSAKLAPSGEAYYDLYFNYGVRWYSDNIHGTDLASLVSASTIYYTISGENSPLLFTKNDAFIKNNNYDVMTVNLIQKEASRYTELYRDLNNVPDITERPVTVPEEEVNLAAKKQGYASSNARGSTAGVGTRTVGNLTDGSTSSYIVLHQDDEDPWFAVDLGETTKFNKVVLYWGADSPYEDSVRAKYSLEGSNQLEEGYVEIKTGECTEKGRQEITFDNVNYQYVRIHVTEKTGTYTSLYEMEVYQSESSGEEPGEDETIRILFIGNSLTEYNDVPNKVKQIFAKAGKYVEVEKLINLGQPLTLHKDNAETKEKILNGNFDYVVLQDKASGFKQSMLEEGVAAIAPWIEEAGAQLVLYMPWANEDVFAEGQETFTNAYVSVGKERNAKLAPSGEAYYDLYFNYGVRWYSDNIHGTDLASLVSASAIYYTISDVSEPITFTKSDAFISSNNYDVMTVNLIQKEASRYTELYRDLNNVPDITNRPIVPPEPEEEINLAEKKQGYASSNARQDAIGMRTVSNLTDGKTTTFIVLHQEDPDPWFAVDLGAPTEFNKAVLYWGADSPYEDSARAVYAVEGSDSLEEGYEEIAAGECIEKGSQEIAFDNVSYRYVRIHVKEKKGTYISLYEMELYKEKRTQQTTYTVTFDSDGGTSVKAQTVESGKTATEPTAPTKDGFKFAGWYIGEEKYDFTAAVMSGLTLKAKWEAVEPETPGTDDEISLEKAVITLSPNSFVYDGKAKEPAVTVTLDGKALTKDTDFTVAYSDNTAVGEAAVTITGKGSYTGTRAAKFTITPADDKPITYKVTFDSNGGSPVDVQNVKKGETAKEPTPPPARSGYTFAGWFNGTAAYNFSTPVNSDLTLTASWKASGSQGTGTGTGTGTGQTKVSKITITGNSKSIAAGKKITLKANVAPSNAANKKVKWTTSNKNYATVSSKGVVTTKKAGVGKKVTITAAAQDGSNKKNTYKITIVNKAVKKVKLTAKTKTVKAGKKLTVKAKLTVSAKINKKSKNAKANKTLAWTSKNTKWATVNKKGVVTTKKAGKGKTVTITAAATDGSRKKATIKIKIK